MPLDVKQWCESYTAYAPQSNQIEKHSNNAITHAQSELSLAPVFLFAYGSLLSQDSRHRFSQIKGLGLPATAQGFKRSWCTRSLSEHQTYVGAIPSTLHAMNGQLFKTQIDLTLATREQDYRFVHIAKSAITLLNQAQWDIFDDYVGDTPIYLCETLAQHDPSSNYPIHYSYIDTCLIGCLQNGGEAEMRLFIETTAGWDKYCTINDRREPQYPRAAKITDTERAIVKSVVSSYDL